MSTMSLRGLLSANRTDCGGVTISLVPYYVLGMKFCGASIPMPIAPRTSVSEMVIPSCGENLVVVALQLYARPQEKKGVSSVATHSLFVPMRRHEDGGLIADLNRSFVPERAVVIDDNGDIHAQSEDGLKVFTTSELRARKGEALWVPNPNLMCRYAAGTATLEALGRAAVNIAETSPFVEFRQLLAPALGIEATEDVHDYLAALMDRDHRRRDLERDLGSARARSKELREALTGLIVIAENNWWQGTALRDALAFSRTIRDKKDGYQG